MTTEESFFRRHLRWAALAGLVWSSVISVQAQPIVVGFERFHRGEQGAAAAVGGELLLNELNCVACHVAPEGWSERLKGRGKISLADVGNRFSAETLRAFLSDPHAFKPGTVMPAMPLSGDAEKNAIAAFLASLRSPNAIRSFPTGDAAKGRQLFERVGCTSCHAPEGKRTTYSSVPIALAAHMDRDALASFLKDPLHTRPAGRMPATELSDTEAADLAAFLAPVKPMRHEATGAAIAVGKAAFERVSCVACHETGQTHPVQPAAPLAQLNPSRGCLAETPAAKAPRFNLSAVQRTAITAAITAVKAIPSPASLTAEQSVDASLERLNCYACHSWRGKGGLEPERASLLAANDGSAESLGEMGRLPPKLDQAGRKLTTEWLEKVLWGKGGGVRPYLTVRMPRFGAGNGAPLIPLLAEACQPVVPEVIDTSGTKGHQRSETGRALMGTGNGGLGCVACHGIRDREPSGVRAINLTHTAQRLRPEYFKALLLDPQKQQPGTVMPPLLAGRKNADREIESLWTYLKELDQNPRVPDGLGTMDSFELKPELDGRPMVFRTFLWGAGTHAIAVGFPARVHVAFDAFEVRWAIAWRGRFLDALANWEERAMPPVKPLGEGLKTFERRSPLAALRSPDERWPGTAGTSGSYVFKGYRLEPDGTPIFRYTVDGLEVEDVMRPAKDGAALHRVVTIRGLKGDRGAWYFRGISDAVPRPIEWREGIAVIEETITF